MSLRTRLTRPEYLFNIRAVIERLRAHRTDATPPKTKTLGLPWSQRITMFPDDLGRTVEFTGVFDLCATEVIHRLIDPGDRVADVGANVGYFTNLMALRAGPTGRVFAFEPDPRVWDVLERNATRWKGDSELAPVEIAQLALSDHAGTGRLQSPGTEDSHMGLSSLESGDGQAAGEFTVELSTLDEVFTNGQLQLLKIDVEGHERAVVGGAAKLLSERRIRDVVFEEHAIYPAPSMTFLEDHGMTLFALKQSMFKLRVDPIEQGPAPPGWPGPNYLATLEPERALQRLRPRGWEALGGVALLGRVPNGVRP